ncbi:hypothetical protein GCM10010215_41840 [Streptomyces virginiae]|uniref:Uncharacterized protein n=1 Tax=Streptomyces virginiae TaxID=1961 RepID=A0ABQ3NPC9_STRVG|nr:hypothetical protein [Streptomyces virginiae]MBP2341534.1 hypothetical protein [Streptomyces virginiae]GGQ12469.1 hypothetical protein GCM10010215_41840 [Streptomyces virginiae]GHI14597.1 hypothetical protein Scinn_40600 [Streptomyces virginiae]
MTGSAWQEFLDHEPRRTAEQYYLRIPDVAALLDALRPLFWQRLTAAGIDRTADEELFQALFPPLTADVLSYYLPYQ